MNRPTPLFANDRGKRRVQADVAERNTRHAALPTRLGDLHDFIVSEGTEGAAS